MPDLVLVNAGELVTCGGRGTPEERLGIIKEGAMVVEAGRVAWVGTTRELGRRTFGRADRTVDADGGLVTPGFVDPHTHLVFAGTREDELERKTGGESYTDILASGGGILRTVRDTSKATVAEIARESAKRLAQLSRNGVTTAEVKTGYGLEVREELRLLEVIERLRAKSAVELVPTFLGLHARPRRSSRAGYAERVVREVLPAVAGYRLRPRFSDCFCEEGVFSRGECRRYLGASKELGFGLKVHADEFSDSGGAALAAEMECVSADHLGRSPSSGIGAMARKGVGAVLLPGTSLISGIPFADARGIIESGCHVALGTDLSPNSWVESPQLVMGLGCNGMRMTPAEVLLAFTTGAARALAREDVGSLAPGCQADFVVHSYPTYKSLPYRVGGSYVRRVFKRGREV